MLNKIMLIGNLGKDPDFNVTSDGTPVARFSLAVNRYSKNSSGERVKETDWFNIVVWRQLAEICEKYLHKGSKVYIEGRLSVRKFNDKEGIQRTAVEVVASDMKMLDSKEASGGSSSYAASEVGASSSTQGDEFDPFLDADDLP
ncbi:MAG TPA: single-stranded DNA-binding protein [Ktedonobacteraceae bacterium]|nr:single-stranded DNA-binding protein [Ktedonobacteraceae bacterium]